MNVNWVTVIFEVINFGLLMLILLRFVFRPLRRTLDERKQAMVERDQRIAEREDEAQATRAELQTELGRIDEIERERVAEALADARGQGERLIDEARARAQSDLDKARVEAARARTRTLERFHGEVLQLGAEAARRVIAGLGATEISEAFAHRGVRSLEDAVDGRGIHGPIEVETSPDIDSGVVESMLRQSFGELVELRVAVDETMVAGIRLHAEGHEIDASAGGSLDHWYQDVIASSVRPA